MSNSTSSNTDADVYVNYRYSPSKAAAVPFTILFFTSTNLHMYQMIRNRAWFLIPFIIGGLFEATGYIGRI